MTLKSISPVDVDGNVEVVFLLNGMPRSIAVKSKKVSKAAAAAAASSHRPKADKAVPGARGLDASLPNHAPLCDLLFVVYEGVTHSLQRSVPSCPDVLRWFTRVGLHCLDESLTVCSVPSCPTMLYWFMRVGPHCLDARSRSQSAVRPLFAFFFSVCRLHRRSHDGCRD